MQYLISLVRSKSSSISKWRFKNGKNRGSPRRNFDGKLIPWLIRSVGLACNILTELLNGMVAGEIQKSER